MLPLAALSLFAPLSSAPAEPPRVVEPMSAAAVSEAPADSPTLVDVGDRAVKGRDLRVYDNAWMGAGEEPITEVVSFVREDGRKLLVREQLWPIQPGIASRTELVLDASTLETVRLTREFVGLPPGASLGGGTPIKATWTFDGADYAREMDMGDGPSTSDDALPQRMFNGGGLGLVLAALPLDGDYAARLPVFMALSGSEFTLYWVDARVSGTETFETAEGREVEAFIVDVDWLDYESKEITSAGGASKPGGAYFVVPKPPKGFPYIPRYANDQGGVDVVFAD